MIEQKEYEEYQQENQEAAVLISELLTLHDVHIASAMVACGKIIVDCFVQLKVPHYRIVDFCKSMEKAVKSASPSDI